MLSRMATVFHVDNETDGSVLARQSDGRKSGNVLAATTSPDFTAPADVAQASSNVTG